MIKKLYNFKSLQLNQQMIQKKQLLGKIFDIDETIKKTNISLSTASVKPFGAIGDFKVLEIHKNSMRFELSKLQREKKFLEAEIISFDKVIVELQKEMEQYSYILKQEQKNKIKKDEKNDELVASEYMQSKWIGKR
jgi:hypothetical protein